MDAEKYSLSEREKYSLSDKDIRKLTSGQTKIIKYVELSKYKSIDSVMHPHNSLTILYETSPNYGHWVCLIRRGRIIEHFDSYGLKPDDELKFIPEYFRNQSGRDIPHLSYLLYYATPRYEIHYNEYKLQSRDKEIATCGRWVCTRINKLRLTTDEFAEAFKDPQYTPDQLVTLLTDEKLL